MKHGQHAANIEEQCRKTNSPLPDFLANKPTLDDGLQFAWAAFWDLSTCRGVGMGEGPIPWDAINAYGIRYAFYNYEFDRFARIIRTMDNAYLKYRQKNDKSKAPINPNRGKTKEKPTMRTK